MATKKKTTKKPVKAKPKTQMDAARVNEHVERRKKAKKTKRELKVNQIYKTLKTAIVACKKKGIDIVDGEWGVDMDSDLGYFIADQDKAVCPMGALLVHKNGSVKFDAFRGERELSDLETDETAAYILGVDQDWVSNFISGFDGSNPDSVEEEIGYDSENGKFLPVRKISAQTFDNRLAYLMGQRIAKEFGIRDTDTDGGN